MDEIVLLKEILDLKESLGWFNKALGRTQQKIIRLKEKHSQTENYLESLIASANAEIRQQRKRILELEERLLDTDKITTREIARLKRDAAWRMDLVPLAIKVAEHRRARILELEDQLVDAKLELRLKDVQNQM